MSMLSFDEVTVRYGAATVLDGVSLTVPDGEVVGLVGESGSGKSTLARAAVGLTPLAGGGGPPRGQPPPAAGRRADPPRRQAARAEAPPAAGADGVPGSLLLPRSPYADRREHR